MHRKDPLLGHQVVHDGEDALFHFAGILSPQDDDFTGFEVEAHVRVRGNILDAGIGRNASGVEDDKIGLAERSQFVRAGPDKHVVHEQRVIGPRADHSHLEAVGRIPTGVAVQDVDVAAAIEIFDGTAAIEAERLGGDPHIHGTPPDIVPALRVLYNPLVLWAAPRFFAGMGGDRSRRCNHRFVPYDGVFVELGWCDVSIHRVGLDPVID